jgi:WD40 repeat protein
MFRYIFPVTCLVFMSSIGAGAVQDQSPAVDLAGDPLPQGALMRLGSVRFRHDDTILFAAFLPGDKRVLSVSADGVICIWEYPSGRRLGRFGQEIDAKLPAETEPKVASAALSPDRQRLLVFGTDSVLSIWDWANAKLLGTVASAGTGPRLSGGPIYAPDGKSFLVFGGSRVLQIVDVAGGKEVTGQGGHGGPLESIEFSADGKQIITKDAKSLHRWDAATGKAISSSALPAPKMASVGKGKKAAAKAKAKLAGGAIAQTTFVSPDGRITLEVESFVGAAKAVGAAPREAVFLDTESGKELGKIGLEVVELTPRHRKPLVYSPNSKFLAAVAGNERVRIDIYEVPTGKLLRSMDAGPSGNLAGKNGVGQVMTPLTQKLVWSQDGRFLFFQFDPACPIVICDSITCHQLGTISAAASQGALESIFSPDGWNILIDLNDGTIEILELATGQKRHAFGVKLPPLPAEAKAATPLQLFAGIDEPDISFKPRARHALAPNHKSLAMSGPGGAVHIWDLLSGKELGVLKGHTAAVTGLAFAPDGKTLASASEDATALIWDMTSFNRPRPVTPLKLADMEKGWLAMSGEDAAKAYAAMAQFATAPDAALDWLKQRIVPVPHLDPVQVNGLIVQLDNDQYKIREAAQGDLLKIGEPLLPFVDKVLAKDSSQETKTRLEGLRSKLVGQRLEGERLRIYRAVELLEIIGTPGARQYLQTLAAGAPGALLTESAREAIRKKF